MIFSLISYCVEGKWSNISRFIAFKHFCFTFCFQLRCLWTFQTKTSLSNIQLCTVPTSVRRGGFRKELLQQKTLALFFSCFCSVTLAVKRQRCAGISLLRFISNMLYIICLYRQICTSTMMPMNESWRLSANSVSFVKGNRWDVKIVFGKRNCSFIPFF